jgi:hypothetical protein
MACHQYEVGIRDRGTGKMMHRTWTVQEVLDAVPWLQRMNARGNDIYIRPGRDENRAMVLVDDIDGVGVETLKERGCAPACVIETSHKNLQAWVDFGGQMPEAQRKEVARGLAKAIDADPASADARHYGRLAGFTNRKPEYMQDRGYPYVLCRDSSGSQVEPAKARAIKEWAARQVEAKERAQAIQAQVTSTRTKRDNPQEAYRVYMRQWLEQQKDKPDWSKGDYAVSCRMLSEGYTKEQVREGIETQSPDVANRKEPDLAKYAQRTVEAAALNPNVVQAVKEMSQTYTPTRRGPRMR